MCKDLKCNARINQTVSETIFDASCEECYYLTTLAFTAITYLIRASVTLLWFHFTLFHTCALDAIESTSTMTTKTLALLVLVAVAVAQVRHNYSI